ncbi:hypothetical protein [Ancylomarina sp. 16SWW S1-10-2]|uniref:hypothetical protein n=1 Tax=Ancylomarina sp. 16SWW S1-10-2 TaxID=2499681 RepID=UPI0012AD51BC|nr:hypothetical protein [Ancylomarina sp. 16SWW S1-10-2]MRT94589.1 hypothetical protein [Ancylomarina sp. 16SWW S1-10-2]
MKKIILILAVSAMFLVSCTESKTKKETTDAPKVENQEMEVSKADSLTNKIENAKVEVEKAAEEVDKALDEL